MNLLKHHKVSITHLRFQTIRTWILFFLTCFPCHIRNQCGMFFVTYSTILSMPMKLMGSDPNMNMERMPFVNYCKPSLENTFWTLSNLLSGNMLYHPYFNPIEKHWCHQIVKCEALASPNCQMWSMLRTQILISPPLLSSQMQYINPFISFPSGEYLLALSNMFITSIIWGKLKPKVFKGFYCFKLIMLYSIPRMWLTFWGMQFFVVHSQSIPYSTHRNVVNELVLHFSMRYTMSICQQGFIFTNLDPSRGKHIKMDLHTHFLFP